MSAGSYGDCLAALRAEPATWLVTGVAGFIGSALLKVLLEQGQRVRGFDNLSTGYMTNIEQVLDSLPTSQRANFALVEGDIRDEPGCRAAVDSVDYVLHQAALGSVPFSIEQPKVVSANNVDGFLNILVSARDAGVRRVVYASSSACYGDIDEVPNVEALTGRPLSPYAVTKSVNEVYADVFARNYAIESVGLRYFNVYGPRQDPAGAYPAVIPKWISALVEGAPVQIFGDGETTRDFCFVDDVVQANLLAAVTADPRATNQIYNVAYGEGLTLNALLAVLHGAFEARAIQTDPGAVVYGDFRPGDIRHSQADISKARALLGYEPMFPIRDGIDLTIDWYRRHG